MTVRKKRTIPLPALAGGAALLIITALFLLLRPKPVWLVEESLSADWSRFLRDSAAAPPFRRIETRSPGTPGKGTGFIITTRRDGAAAEGEGAVVLYPWLSRTREWEGALVLAVNPWMVFRKHENPLPDRARLDTPAGGAGVLICPGGEDPAVFAWVSQLLQDQPGSFPGGAGVWEQAERDLFLGRRFQNGAMTYRWVDVWPLLYRSDVAWVYAPLSMVRELPSYRMGLLAASRFPEKEGWNEYGIQADVLWAVPFGSEAQKRKLAAAGEWLKDPRVQTEIANTINWIPAHPQGIPYNPVSWESQVAWINSSFIWQGAAHGQEHDH
jgi:hypothetical protein